MFLVKNVWKKEFNMLKNRVKIGDLFITSIVCLFISIFMYIFALVSVLSSQENDIKKIISKYINNVLIVEVNTVGGEIIKGSAIIINPYNVISVAHLFSFPVESIIAYSYNKQSSFNLTLIDCNESKDLALLSTDVKVGDYKNLKMISKTEVFYGDKIVKIGNALGQGISIDSGIVSNPFQKIEFEDNVFDVIQVSINIRSGDSGGAIFNTKGEFLGIISFKTNNGLNSSDSLSYIIPSFVISVYLDSVNQ